MLFMVPLVTQAVAKLILRHSKNLFVFNDMHLTGGEWIFTNISLWSSDLCFHQQTFLAGN